MTSVCALSVTIVTLRMLILSAQSAAHSVEACDNKHSIVSGTTITKTTETLIV